MKANILSLMIVYYLLTSCKSATYPVVYYHHPKVPADRIETTRALKKHYKFRHSLHFLPIRGDSHSNELVKHYQSIHNKK